MVDLSGITGLGDKKIADLVASGVKSRKDLLKKSIYNGLPLETKLFLKLSPKSMSRKSAKTMVKGLRKLLPKFKVAGSYRRKKPKVNDLDLIMLVEDYKKVEHIFVPGEEPTQLGDYKFYTMAKGPEKVALFCKHKSKCIKFDIFITTTKKYPFMLLYVTGSQLFNIRMRQHAKRLGYKLNQTELVKGTIKVKNIKTERDIFTFLDYPYRTPKERNWL